LVIAFKPEAGARRVAKAKAIAGKSHANSIWQGNDQIEHGEEQSGLKVPYLLHDGAEAAPE
jgi:hypothetical protein